MKVLVLFPDSISKPVGGLGVQFKNLYSRLSDKIDFYVVGFPEGEKNEVKHYRPAINPTPGVGMGSALTLMGHIVYLSEGLEYPKPDIVHAYDWTTYLSGYYLAKYHKVPLLLTMQLSVKGLHEAGIAQCVDYGSIDGKVLHDLHYNHERFVLSKADKIINVSQGYTKHTEGFEDLTVIIPNGIDLNEWVPKNKMELPGENRHKIVYIGRFVKMKALDILSKANIPKEIDLILIGDPTYGETEINQGLVDMVEKQDNVYYIGPQYGQDKVDILHSADAVIMPSRHEPFGIVALEALASKSILLSSRIDGMGDFLDDSNSIKIELTVEGIEKAFYDYLALTEEQKQSIIKNGLETCKKYNWDDIADQYYEIYKSLI